MYMWYTMPLSCTHRYAEKRIREVAISGKRHPPWLTAPQGICDRVRGNRAYVGEIDIEIQAKDGRNDKFC